ncbi:sensor histidine kinase [Undibacterium sp. Ji42W]|uniref:sensor histidine kinase n=1 Tax=Undibacterium sp. Ji42W TaxID=3413039 RepID=UPI003BEF693D
MSLKRRLLAYLFFIHGIFLVLAFSFYLSQPLLIICVELGLACSLALGIYLLNKVLQPLDFAQQFHDLLQDENYASRIKGDSNKEINELVVLFNRMLEALYKERLELGEQRGFLDRLLEATPTAVIVFDFDDKISLMNTSAQNLLDVTETAGLNLQQLILKNKIISSTELLQQLQQLLPGDSAVYGDTEGRRYRCQRNQFTDRGFKRDFVLIDEITAELASSEKATYEKLIRVLAHEVNNTVAATGSVLESLLFYRGQLQTEDSHDFVTAIAAVRKRNGNLGEFIERFTRVVKMPEPELKPHDLAAMLDGIVYLYRQQCNELGITFKWLMREEIPLQMLDGHLMEQALLNIVKNAIEAVETSIKPGLQKTGYVNLELRRDADTQAIMLSVRDSANLLSEVPHGQLFTPFFTTKKGGQGIGLMFVREVLNRHGYSHKLMTNGQGETSFDILIDG